MSEELIAEVEETKPKRKAPAKKAAAKKTAAKKPAAKTARKTAKKKAAEATELEMPLAVATETATPAPAEPVATAVEAPAPAPEAVEPAPAAPVENNDNVEKEEGDEAADAAGGAPGDNNIPRYMIMGENGQLRPMTSKERRKAKFERWKQRRAERRNGGGGGERQMPVQGSEPQAGNGQDREIEPEKPLGPPEPANGILEMSPKGYGFLRRRELSFAQNPLDAFIAPEFIRKYCLREGMQIVGVQCKGHRGPQVTEVTEVNGRAPEAMRDTPLFEELKAVNPNKRYQLETVKDRLTTRVIDMLTPVGRGQRGLIVAPPRAGKTTMLQHIAEAVTENHPGVHLMILLVDERPEEVTEFKRILPRAEIFASNNDQDVKSHTRIAAFAIERAKRLVECGEHVFILMDSITRMARAFNSTHKSGGYTSGGIGAGALEIPRRLFAAARNTRTAGSLTILGTALVETGSKADDLIFQEFKGTGNMELVLDRRIAEQFVFPAVNIFKSGTRREELLLQTFQLDKIHMLRRGLAGHKPIEAIQRVISLLERYPNNAQMLVDLPSKS
ncbi:transcription termination factor Rho [Prosthecobacter sp.]|jgi:transcription termination factor Rho|uniref:transcription termination factor Rho n=1 Tax=Prosthecobacter sp. TaxID=1965333 RepID=UPI003784E182